MCKYNFKSITRFHLFIQSSQLSNVNIGNKNVWRCKVWVRSNVRGNGGVRTPKLVQKN